jgi:glutaredoxin
MITIYGKLDCKMCEKAKEKLSLMNVKFTFVDVSDLFPWRENNLMEFMVEKTMREDNGKPELPLILAHDRWLDYPQAMAFFKGGGNA